MKEDVSVVICAHDMARWELLQTACGSLEQQILQPREVIVVVDHNEELARHAQKGLSSAIVVENTRAQGLGEARNTGFSMAAGSIVAFLDDDAVACPEWLSLLVAPYRDREVAAVGGRAEPMWERERPRWFPSEFDWVVGCSYLGMPRTTQEVRNVFGCNMSFRREVLDELGGFRLGYGCDETELCIRLRQRWPEKKILYVPEAKVLHHVPRVRTRFNRFVSRCYFEGGSKAVVSHLVGAAQGLASERQYTRTVLPAGVRRGLSDLVRDRDLYGAARAGAIITGLASTAAGYVAASFLTEGAARKRGWSGRV